MGGTPGSDEPNRCPPADTSIPVTLGLDAIELAPAVRKSLLLRRVWGDATPTPRLPLLGVYLLLPASAPAPPTPPTLPLREDIAADEAYEEDDATGWLSIDPSTRIPAAM